MDTQKGSAIIEFREHLNLTDLSAVPATIEFAMWLPSEQDQVFTDSLIKEKWNTIYELTKHCWSYITADMLKTLHVVDDGVARINLPNNFQAFIFNTKENEPVILSLETEKGIRLHLASTTTLYYRIDFLDKFIRYCDAFRYLVEFNNGDMDADTGVAGWWTSTREVSIEAEKKGPLKGVGKIAR
jgi:hypothetical protein